jgi:hypothetical protein
VIIVCAITETSKPESGFKDPQNYRHDLPRPLKKVGGLECKFSVELPLRRIIMRRQRRIAADCEWLCLNADMRMVGTPCSPWPENISVAVMMICARQNQVHLAPYKLFDLCS